MERVYTQPPCFTAQLITAIADVTIGNYTGLELTLEDGSVVKPPIETTRGTHPAIGDYYMVPDAGSPFLVTPVEYLTEYITGAPDKESLANDAKSRREAAAKFQSDMDKTAADKSAALKKAADAQRAQEADERSAVAKEAAATAPTPPYEPLTPYPQVRPEPKE